MCCHLMHKLGCISVPAAQTIAASSLSLLLMHACVSKVPVSTESQAVEFRSKSPRTAYFARSNKQPESYLGRCLLKRTRRGLCLSLVHSSQDAGPSCYCRSIFQYYWLMRSLISNSLHPSYAASLNLIIARDASYRTPRTLLYALHVWCPFR